MAYPEAFKTLQSYHAAALETASVIPQEDSVQCHWQGLGFKVSDICLLSELGEVSELMPVPRLTALPNVKSWMMGIASVRGRLIPVVNLTDYLQMPVTEPGTLCRVLVVEDGDMIAGFVVDQTLGIKYFRQDRFEPEVEKSADGLGRYVTGRFTGQKQHFQVIQLKSILRDQKFLAVGHDQ